MRSQFGAPEKSALAASLSLTHVAILLGRIQPRKSPGLVMLFQQRQRVGAVGSTSFWGHQVGGFGGKSETGFGCFPLACHLDLG